MQISVLIEHTPVTKYSNRIVIATVWIFGVQVNWGPTVPTFIITPAGDGAIALSSSIIFTKVWERAFESHLMS